ncbi:hypothetical protein AOLI_G00001320 [Acnodon oligacanthus]
MYCDAGEPLLSAPSSSLSPNQGLTKEVFVHNAQNKDMFTSAVATMAHIWTAPSEEGSSDYSVPHEIQVLNGCSPTAEATQRPGFSSQMSGLISAQPLAIISIMPRCLLAQERVRALCGCSSTLAALHCVDSGTL